jgi:hypothetical protein
MMQLKASTAILTVFILGFSGAALAQTASDSGASAIAPAVSSSPATIAQATDLSARSHKRKARSKKKLTRRQEIDKSIKSGTVPSRYRNSIPKEYQQYIPFEKN